MFYHLAPLDCSTAAARAARRAVVGRLSLHAEDVRYVLVSELSKKKDAAGRLLCHGFTSRALGLSLLARVKAVVPSGSVRSYVYSQERPFKQERRRREDAFIHMPCRSRLY